MFRIKTKTIICDTEEQLDNLLRAHYTAIRQNSLASINWNSYSVKAVLAGILSNEPHISYYEVTMPLSEWRVIEEKAVRRDTLELIFSGEYFNSARGN